jgi:hypothetical protein
MLEGRVDAGAPKLQRSGMCLENRQQIDSSFQAVRQRGAKRGIRLIVFDSLMEYLRGLSETGRGGVS